MKKRLIALMLAFICLLNSAPLSVFATEVEETEPVCMTEEVEIVSETEIPAEETDPANESNPDEEIATVEETTPTEATEPETDDDVIVEEDTPSDQVYADNLMWNINGDGVLKIYGTGLMYDYETIEATPWYQYRESILALVVSEGITGIGANAFAMLPNLQTVTLPLGLRSIGEGAFSGCSNLIGIYFQGDAPEAISNDAFADVTATIYYPAGNTTWTEEVMMQYGLGMNIYWNVYCAVEHVYGTTVTEPTCTAEGYSVHTCIYCGDSYTDTFVPALGHVYVNGSCTGCGKVFKAPIVSATNATNGKVKLSWTAVEGAIGYKVYRSESLNGTYKATFTTAGLTYTNSKADVGKTYYYYVVAIDELGGTSAPSIISEAVCLPARPSVSVKADADTGKIHLSWKSVEGAVNYKVYRSNGANGIYELKATVTDSYYTNYSAMYGETFHYYVVAVSANGYESVASQKVSCTATLERPVVTVSNNPVSGKVTLTWKAIPGAVSYDVYRSDAKDGTFKKVYTATGTTYTNSSKAIPGNTYYYKVMAIAADSKANSAFSTIKSRTVDCAQPVINAYAGATGKPYVTWKPVEGAVTYKVYRASSENGTYKLVFTTEGTTYTNSKAEIGVRYYYKVKAVPANTAGTSVFSEVDNAKGVKNSYKYTYAKYSTTKYGSSAARNVNLKLACKAINGTILAPGEEFSFNEIVGPRTAKKGYQLAPVYNDAGTGRGGGVCQVAGTIFNAALLGNLKISKRYQHSKTISYVPRGRDATIYTTKKDFRFINNTEYYIKIQAKASGGTVTMTLLTRESGVSPTKDVKLRVTRQKDGTYVLTRTFQGVVNYTTKSKYSNL